MAQPSSRSFSFVVCMCVSFLYLVVGRGWVFAVNCWRCIGFCSELLEVYRVFVVNCWRCIGFCSELLEVYKVLQ